MADFNKSFKTHNVILFQGNSITAAGRDYWHVGPNSGEGLGAGYVQKIADQILKDQPEDYLQIYNRGISGNQIRDLVQRWEMDSLRLLPDIISILIGVNDTWNYVLLGMGSDQKTYQKLYKNILNDSRQVLPDVQFILCEPFILLTGEVNEDWMKDISQRQEIVRSLAEEYAGVFVPFQEALDQESKQTPAHQLLHDGVHPTDRGHQLLADCWLKTVLG
jgi:lysophospholipase L1-like esterase